MDRALAFIGVILSALSFLPTLSDPARWWIFGIGMALGLGGLGHMAWERRLVVAGWFRRPPPVEVPAAPAMPEYTSLYEVALRAYEATRDTQYGYAAERIGHGGPITYYALLIDDDFQIYGRRSPSRVMEPFDPRGFSYELEGESVIGKEDWGGSARWVDLSIRTANVEDAIALIVERTRDEPAGPRP